MRWIVSVILVLLAVNVYAFDAEFRGIMVESDAGMEARIGHEFVYVYANQVRDSQGLGVGLRAPLVENLGAWVQGGYYWSDDNCTTTTTSNGLVACVPAPPVTKSTTSCVDCDDWGAEAGLDYHYEIESFSLIAEIGWRWVNGCQYEGVRYGVGIGYAF